MRLDASADFWGKNWVFSQTNSHLLSGRGSGKKGKRRQLSQRAADAWMLASFAKPTQKKQKICFKDNFVFHTEQEDGAGVC